MTEEQRKNHEKQQARAPYAGPTKPSMLRRSDYHDYSSRRLYLITMTTQGRQPLLGRLAGTTTAPAGSPEAPHVELSALGQLVAQEWMGIGRYYPQVSVVATCVMPDHLHGILFVREQLSVHLGHVIRGFKQGCTKAFWRLTGLRPSGPSPAPAPSVPVGRDSSRQPQGPLLWAPGYNDRILLENGQLQRWIDYLNDNPWRLAMKREHPQLFRVDTVLPLFSTTFSAMGNRFLLHAPEKLQVQCSRSLTSAQIEDQKRQFLARAKAGAVLVSPSYSRGEKAVMQAAFEAGARLVVLMNKGFSQLQKPPKRFFDACAEGRMLWLSPYAYSNREVRLTRAVCLELNEYARRICEEL